MCPDAIAVEPYRLYRLFFLLFIWVSFALFLRHLLLPSRMTYNTLLDFAQPNTNLYFTAPAFSASAHHVCVLIESPCFTATLHTPLQSHSPLKCYCKFCRWHSGNRSPEISGREPMRRSKDNNLELCTVEKDGFLRWLKTLNVSSVLLRCFSTSII